MKAKGQMSESMPLAIFLTLAGGLQDAYSYNCRGKVFANAQTGNIVLLGQNLAEGNWGVALRLSVVFMWQSAFRICAKKAKKSTGDRLCWSFRSYCCFW